MSLDVSDVKLMIRETFSHPRFILRTTSTSLLIKVSLTIVMYFPCSVLGAWVWGKSGFEEEGVSSALTDRFLSLLKGDQSPGALVEK